MFLSSVMVGAKLSYPTLLKCLRAYQSLDIGPCTAMPYSFVVPEASELFPGEAHGVKLGNVISRIRTRGDYMKDEEQRKELEALGFKPKKERKRDVEFEKIVQALKIYRRRAGDVDVPNKFECIGDGWPASLQGYKLGSRVHSMRYQGAYRDSEEMRRRLQAVGFNPRARKRATYGGPLVLSALRSYRELHGDLRVPLDFEVPIDDPRYPIETHGMKLGHVVMHTRNRGSYKEYRDQLDALGFEWIPQNWRDKEFQAILEQL